MVESAERTLYKAQLAADCYLEFEMDGTYASACERHCTIHWSSNIRDNKNAADERWIRPTCKTPAELHTGRIAQDKQQTKASSSSVLINPQHIVSQRYELATVW